MNATTSFIMTMSIGLLGLAFFLRKTTCLYITQHATRGGHEKSEPFMKLLS